MKYSLLHFLVCPVCRQELTLITLTEVPSHSPFLHYAPCSRVSQEGAVVGPVPDFTGTTPMSLLLQQHAGPAAPPARNLKVEVQEGLLICGGCGRWYPIIDAIPELFPDYLRDWQQEKKFLEQVAGKIPAAIHNLLQENLATFIAGSADLKGGDKGAHFKESEIHIQDKIDDPDFFGPGYVAPFNWHNSDYTIKTIQRYAGVISYLNIPAGSVVLDIASGYAWTSEWLMKSGFETIGLDICRTYQEIGVKRMGAFCPHLILADVENLPIRDNRVDVVLCIDSFHHVPDRPLAMSRFSQVLKETGNIYLAEPGVMHQYTPGSIQVMNKYGILEKGMEKNDILSYISGIPGLSATQHFIVKINEAQIGNSLEHTLVYSNSFVDSNIFQIQKAPAPTLLAKKSKGSTRVLNILIRMLGSLGKWIGMVRKKLKRLADKRG